MLLIMLNDIRRATLPISSGNEGWIGVSPTGDAYHVVVPVDVQIARGVMACNRPADGTPFGGYSGWLYFRCPPFGDEPGEEERLLEERVLETSADLGRFLTSYGMQLELVEEASVLEDRASDAPVLSTIARSSRRPGRVSRGSDVECRTLSCATCGKEWASLARFLGDQGIKLSRYEACVDDFSKGAFEFSHSCGALVGVPASRFVRPHVYGKSLIGSHACPGFCYFENSVLACSADCEGSLYRRIAGRLRSKTRGKT